MIFKKLIFVLFVAFLGGTSCTSPSLEDYKTTTPSLSLESFFNGNLNAYGIVLDRNGKLTRRFSVALEANWVGNKGTINEWFIFDDGEKSTRTWQLTKDKSNVYSGTANDVIGVAKGKTSGSALYWQYDLLINVDGTDYQVTLDDWMYLIDKKRLFNKTDIKKFGFKVGEVILYIEKV
jgi:hypothetical protein